MSLNHTSEPNYYKQLLLETIGELLVEQLFAIEGDLIVDIAARRYELIDCPEALKTQILYRLNYLPELAGWEEFNLHLLDDFSGGVRLSR
jgi:hypothetical protein